MNKYQLEAVDRMQSFMIEHVEEDFSIAEVLALSCYSPFHAQRLFMKATGYSVGEWLRKLRLTESAKRLKEGGTSVTDEAFDSGYESVEGFLRAFRSEFHLSPGEYQRNPIPICYFQPYRVKFRESYRREKTNMKEAKNVFIQKIQKPKRKVMIKRASKGDNYWDYSMDVGCDIWGILKSITDEPVSLWLTPKYQKPNTGSYVQGVELPYDWNGQVLEGFEVIEMPETEYLMFQGEPFAEEDYADAIETLEASMEKYDPAFMGYKWSTEEPRIQLEPRGERGYIELRAITKK